MLNNECDYSIRYRIFKLLQDNYIELLITSFNPLSRTPESEGFTHVSHKLKVRLCILIFTGAKTLPVVLGTSSYAFSTVV